MDSNKHSVSSARLEIVEMGRRRRWSEEEKFRIVMESLAAPRMASSTARRHWISRFQLLAWRRALKIERVVVAPAPAFVPAVVVPDPCPSAKAGAPRKRGQRKAAPGRIVIEVGRGRRVVVEGFVDADALARVLDVLDRR
ncbi:MAG: IS66-like element accessory protein TnpA [Janthinobacterium lividum]